VSVVKPATLKALIEIKLEMEMSELKKDVLKFVAYLKKMAIIHDEHCHVVEHKKTGDSGVKNTGKSSDAGSRSFEHNSGGTEHGRARNKASDRDRTKSGHRRSSDSSGTGKQSARKPPPCLNTKQCAARSSIYPTVLTLKRTKLFVIKLSRRDSPKWRMRLAVDHLRCPSKILFLVLFCALHFLHPR
jgi:hypothetical protein